MKVQYDQKKELTLPYWILNKKSNEVDKEVDTIDTIKIDSLSTFCFAPELADKTISLRYRRFRTQRKDIKQLIVRDIKLYKLSDAEIEKYIKTIKYLWRYDASKIDEINKINIGELEISIDLGGFSLELAKLLGLDYLKGNYIIVSSKQKDCDILRNYTSFDYKIRTIFDNYNLDQLLLGESLIGSHNLNIGKIIRNPDNINLEINFDTPTRAVANLKKIKDSEKILMSNTIRLKDKKFLDALYNDIGRMISLHGSTDLLLGIEEIRIRIKTDLGCKFCLYSNKENIDIYCLNNDKKTIFIYFNDGYIKDRDIIKDIGKDDEFLLLNGLDEKTLNILISEGIIGYSPYIGLERAANMIIRNRKMLKLDKNPESLEDMRGLFLKNECEDIPEKARELLIAVKKIKDGYNISEIGNIAIYMAFPLIQNEILYELLLRMKNPNKSIYMNTEKFIEEVSKIDNEQLKIFLNKLLESLEFNEENNLIANTWLEKNKKEICENLGIKFEKKKE